MELVIWERAHLRQNVTPVTPVRNYHEALKN